MSSSLHDTVPAPALSFLDGDAAGSRGAKIRAFEVVLATLIAVEAWCRALVLWEEMSALAFFNLAAATVLAPLALRERTRRGAFAALAANQIVVVARDFPITGNHAYLEAMLCVLAAIVDLRKPEERALFLRAARWIAIVVLFVSGAQKLVHGYYFRGEALAWTLWIDSFRPVLGPLLPPAERTRLTGLSGAVGDGPYAPDGALFVAASNVVWILELVLAALLVPRRTRSLAVVGAIALLAAIEVAARELFFGILFVNLLLVALPGPPSRLRAPVFVGVLGYLLLVRLGLFPGWSFY